jgi:TolB-like protein/tetratricopeptide (TPR) repeat protein
LIVNIRRYIEQFAAELRRRNLIRVVAIYSVTAWVILQVAEVTFEPLGFPAWMMRSIIITAILGLPVTALLAWIIDYRGNKLVLDLPLWVGDAGNPRPKKKSDLVYAALLAVLMVGLTYSAIVLLLDRTAESKGQIASTEAPANSIAVLAFRNFDGHTDSDFFALGLGEEILNLLAGIRELRVAARTSSFQFQNDEVDVREVANLLSVRHVLEGSVRKSQNRIRVTAQLIDGTNGYHMWSKVYDRPLTEIFMIQQEIAAAVVNELQIVLSVDAEQKLQQTPTDNLDAYIYYLQGKERLNSSFDADVVATAIQLFEKAIEIDPAFSRAYSGICQANLRFYEIGNDIANFEEAQAACEQARKLDSGLNSEIYVALGKLFRHRGQEWNDQAEAMLHKAIAISPGDADAYIELAEIRVVQNRTDEAEALFLRAVDLKRNYWKAHEALASFYYSSDRYQKAAASYEIATSLAPDVASGFGGKGAAYTMLGELDKARIAYARSLELKPSRQAFTNIGLSYYYAGSFEDSADMQQAALKYAPDDHRVWGRLAESYRFIPGKEEESNNAYLRATELAEENLLINESDWRTRGLLATYLVHINRIDEAQKQAQKTLTESQNNSEALYYLALVQLFAGDSISAIEALDQAVASNPQYRQFIASDPDLAVLRGTEQFDRILQP